MLHFVIGHFLVFGVLISSVLGLRRDMPLPQDVLVVTFTCGKVSWFVANNYMRAQSFHGVEQKMVLHASVYKWAAAFGARAALTCRASHARNGCTLLTFTAIRSFHCSWCFMLGPRWSSVSQHLTNVKCRYCITSCCQFSHSPTLQLPC